METPILMEFESPRRVAMRHTKLVLIGNGLYARSPLSLMELYRQQQKDCPHTRRDPRGTCYHCGHREVK